MSLYSEKSKKTAYTGTDRRREHRYQATLRAKITTPDPDFALDNAVIVDISTGGLSFRSLYAFTTGADILVECEGCRLDGEVRNCRRREFAAETEYIVGVLVRSIPQGEAHWQELVDRHCGIDT